MILPPDTSTSLLKYVPLNLLKLLFELKPFGGSLIYISQRLKSSGSNAPRTPGDMGVTTPRGDSSPLPPGDMGVTTPYHCVKILVEVIPKGQETTPLRLINEMLGTEPIFITLAAATP